MNTTDCIALINLIILSITLLVLGRYAFDTFKMQKSMTRQVELQSKPLIALDLVDETGKFFLNFTNIGNGTAINIEFEPMVFGNDFSELSFKVDMIQSLKAGESKKVKVTTTIKGENDDGDFWTAHLKPKYANRIIFLVIKYDDIEFKVISQTFELGLGDLKIRMTK